MDGNLKKAIESLFKRKGDWTNKQLYALYPNESESTLRVYANCHRNPKVNKLSNKKVSPGKKVTKKTISSKQFIDDPNELLMSCAKRELNKPNPEVRWANILLQLLDKTKQLEITSKSDVQSRLKQYSVTELVELRKKLIES